MIPFGKSMFVGTAAGGSTASGRPPCRACGQRHDDRVAYRCLSCGRVLCSAGVSDTGAGRPRAHVAAGKFCGSVVPSTEAL